MGVNDRRNMAAFLTAAVCTSVIGVAFVSSTRASQLAVVPVHKVATPSLILNAAVMDRDDRLTILDNQHLVGFSDTEVERMMTCTGSLNCPETDKEISSSGSATLICAPGSRDGKGKCVADRIATVAHIVMDNEQSEVRANVDECFFTNYRGSSRAIKVEDVNITEPWKFMLTSYSKQVDKMVVRLDSPVTTCDPFDLSLEPLKSETDVVVVSIVQEDMDLSYDGSLPIAYPCRVRNVVAGDKIRSTELYSDCDANKGGSGGGTFVRREIDGELALAAMLVAASPKSSNGSSYSFSRFLYTLHIGADGNFVDMAMRPGAPAN